jgi:hypothetical protein
LEILQFHIHSGANGRVADPEQLFGTDAAVLDLSHLAAQIEPSR